METSYKKQEIILTLALLVLVFGALLLSYNRVFDVYELQTLDLRYKLRKQPEIYDKIVIVQISDDSIKKIGSWPFDRKYHALLVKALAHGGAKQIIFDIFFSERKEGDEEFVSAVKEAGNVYMPYVFDLPEKSDTPFPIAAHGYEVKLLDKFELACKETGHINIIPDLDGKFRRIPPLVSFQDNFYPHLGFLAAANYLGYSIKDIEIAPQKKVSLGERLEIPLDINSNIIVNFPGKWVDTFRHYSYVDILTSYINVLEGREGSINFSDFKDAICFIGVTATAEPDIHPSPFESLYPGVGVHASLFNSMIQGKFIKRASKEWNLLILIILGVVTFVSTLRSRRFLSFINLFITLICFFIIAIVLFALFGLWIDVFYPLILSTLLYLGLTFRKYIIEVHRIEVLEKELSIAKNIQESFLPKELPKIEGISIQAKMSTAKQVGGDLYDFIDISERKIGVMIGDVSGKGVPAALYMAKVVSDFKSYAKEGAAFDAIAKLNSRLITESTSNLFVTLTYLIFDMNTRRMNYSTGGHLPTLLFKEGKDEPLLLDLKEGMPLGLMEVPFGDKTIDLEKGDLFILYTDGVTEAMNSKGEMFDQKRLIEIVRKRRDAKLKDLLDSIHREVKIYEGRLPQHDDITVIAIRIE